MDGIINIYKEAGYTSFNVVAKLRGILKERRMGHTGTLDPQATGVLPVCVGKATKLCELLLDKEKTYEAVMLLGITTDTEDMTGTVLTETKAEITEEEVRGAAEKFTGVYGQVPPMYSALKVKGQKLCDLARRGVEVEREARPITVFSIDCEPTESESDYILRVSCSSGTYIRTLCADIGKSLGCGGAMATLCRSRAGDFRLEESYTLDQLEQMTADERGALLLPIDSLFKEYPRVFLPEFYEKLSRNGCEIYQKKIKTPFPVGARVRLCSASSGSFYALGEVREYENGSAIKATKLFDV